MGPIWGQQDPGGPHVGPMNFVIWDGMGDLGQHRLSNCLPWTNADQLPSLWTILSPLPVENMLMLAMYMHKNSMFQIIFIFLKGQWVLYAFAILRTVGHTVCNIWAEVEVTKEISPIPSFFRLFIIVKTLVSYCISRSYLTGVTVVKLQWHPPIMNMIQRT